MTTKPTQPQSVGSSGELGPGDWIALEYGFDKSVFYVLRITEDGGAFLGSPQWLVSSSIFLPKKQIAGAEKLGRGRPRWWWWFVPWRDCCVPFSRPRGLYWA